MRLGKRPGVSEQGVTAAEFAIVLPSFLMLIMIVFAVALGLFSVLLAGTAIPAGARVAGTTQGVGAGYADVQSIMSVAQPAAGAAGSAQIALGVPGCERALYARLNAGGGLRLPLVGDLFVRLQAGALGRRWQFWPGQPADGCE